VPVEGEVHFLDSVSLRADTEFRFGARRRTAEKNEIALIHIADCRLLMVDC